jgi:hypothetical protein
MAVTNDQNVNIILDRITSPLSGSFILSWSIWNWKIILFVFSSDLASKDKIVEILNLSNLKSCFLYPLLSSLAYLFLMPYLLYFFKSFTDHVKFINQLKETRHQQKVSNLTQFEVQSTTTLTLMLAKTIGEQNDRTKALENLVDKIININNYPPLNTNLIQIKTELQSITSNTETALSTNKKILELVNTKKYSQYGSSLTILLNQLTEYLNFKK